MKIRFENNLDDLVAFNRYHWNHSASMRRQRRTNTAIWVAVFAFCSVLWGQLIGSMISGFLAAVLSTLYLLLIKPILTTRYQDAQIRRFYQEGSNSGVVGFHELELTENNLVERNDVGGQITALTAIDKIVSTEHHTLIYVSAVGAHIVPRESVVEGDYTEFIEALRMAHAKVGGTLKRTEA